MAKTKIYTKRDRSRGDVRWKGAVGGSFLSRLIKRPATTSRNNALLWGMAWLILGVIGAWHFRFVATSMVGYTTSGYMPLVTQ